MDGRVDECPTYREDQYRMRRWQMGSREEEPYAALLTLRKKLDDLDARDVSKLDDLNVVVL